MEDTQAFSELCVWRNERDVKQLLFERRERRTQYASELIAASCQLDIGEQSNWSSQEGKGEPES